MRSEPNGELTFFLGGGILTTLLFSILLVGKMTEVAPPMDEILVLISVSVVA